MFDQTAITERREDRGFGNDPDLDRTNVEVEGIELRSPPPVWQAGAVNDIPAPMLTPVERLHDLAALIGTDVGVSDWKLIDQATIDGFAALTGDDGPIHTDPVKAAEIAPFGGTIVQGFMMLSHLTGFAKTLRLPDAGVVFRLNYGFDRVRIITPVPVGSRIRGRFGVAGLENRGPDAALLTLKAQVEVDGIDAPAVVADWLAYLQLAEVAS